MILTFGSLSDCARPFYA